MLKILRSPSNICFQSSFRAVRNVAAKYSNSSAGNEWRPSNADFDVIYNTFPKRIDEAQRVVLSSPDRFQSINERQDRSDLTVDTIKAYYRGKYFIHHRGVKVLKTANDQVVLKELLTHVKPATVIEIGSFTGATALWMADMMQLENIDCSIYSMDIDLSILDERVKSMKPDNLTFFQGDCTKIASTDFSADFLQGLKHPWVVIEDAHVNVCGVMKHFYDFMKPGDYFAVEDTNPHMPAHMGYGHLHHNYVPAGTEVLDDLKKFLKEHSDKCKVDSYFSDFFGYNGTWNWHGYIKCV